MGEVKRRPGRGPVLLAGDAAGFVDPITGEGIGWAIHSGALAAEAAAAALAEGRPAAALGHYRRLAAPMLRELGRAQMLSAMVYHPRLQSRFHDMLARSPRMRRHFLDLLGGDLDYADLGPARLARLGLRLLFGRGRASAG